jgi:hypothetical protein
LRFRLRRLQLLRHLQHPHRHRRQARSRAALRRCFRRSIVRAAVIRAAVRVVGILQASPRSRSLRRQHIRHRRPLPRLHRQPHRQPQLQAQGRASSRASSARRTPSRQSLPRGVRQLLLQRRRPWLHRLHRRGQATLPRCSRRYRAAARRALRFLLRLYLPRPILHRRFLQRRCLPRLRLPHRRRARGRARLRRCFRPWARSPRRTSIP